LTSRRFDETSAATLTFTPVSADPRLPVGGAAPQPGIPFKELAEGQDEFHVTIRSASPPKPVL